MSQSQLPIPFVPATTRSTNDIFTRPDYNRWLVEDRNSAAASKEREAREERRRFKEAQKEARRARGGALQQQQRVQRHNAAGSIEEKQRQAAAIGQHTRQEQAELRERREAGRAAHAAHGRALTERYTMAPAAAEVEALQQSKAEIVREMRHGIGGLEMEVEQTRQEILEENQKQVERVKAETSDEVTRNSKKQFLDDRWDMADLMRENVEAWRQQKNEFEESYIAAGRDLAAYHGSPERVRASRAKLMVDRAASAGGLREDREDAQRSLRGVRDGISREKQEVHQTIHSNKFVPDEENNAFDSPLSATARSWTSRSAHGTPGRPVSPSTKQLFSFRARLSRQTQLEVTP